MMLGHDKEAINSTSDSELVMHLSPPELLHLEDLLCGVTA